MLFSMMTNLNMLLLPVFTVLLTAIMSEQHVSDRGVIWAALEAIGTIAAFLAVVCLAWSERSRDRRNAERKRYAIRAVLNLEIERNIEGLYLHAVQIPSDFGRFNVAAFLTKGIETYIHTKSKLEDQLDLYTSALDAHEIMTVTAFYKKLSQLEGARQNLMSNKMRSDTNLNVLALDWFEGLVSREEFMDLEKQSVEDVLFHAVKQLYTMGLEISKQLEIGVRAEQID